MSLLSNVPVFSDEKQKLLLEQYKSGDTESGGRLIHSLAPFIWRIVQSVKSPLWIDKEEVMTDCFTACYEALLKYDPQRSSIQTYLFPVIHRKAWRSIGWQVKGSEYNLLPSDLAIHGTHESNHNELIQEVQGVLDRIPRDEMNERSRQVAVLLMRGRTSGQIASAMEWDRSFTSRFIDEVRIHLAWRMVQDGVSAEPFIKNAQLRKMAMEFEEKHLGMF